MGNTVTVHNNHFYFDDSQVTGSNIKYKISNGQPYQNTTFDYNSEVQETTVTVQAGRHASTDVADWFNNGLSSSHIFGTDSPIDSKPSELNFAIEFDATFCGGDTTLDGFKLGQGHKGSDNNWWFGHSSCSSDFSGTNLDCGGVSFSATCSASSIDCVQVTCYN